MQVYGDAVVDEAPLLILSNYLVTIFLKRSQHCWDKRLWASEPIWWDQTQPSARACWLHAFQLAAQMAPMKSQLPRRVVPQTMEGYKVSIPQPHPQTGKGRLRERRTRVNQLKASSSSNKGYDVVPLGASQCQAQVAAIPILHCHVSWNLCMRHSCLTACICPL